MSVMAANWADPTLREVRLYGVLAKRFGRVHRLAVGSVREAMQALCVVVPGFRTYLLEHSEPGYHVFLGAKGKNNLGADQLELPVSTKEAICVVPVVAGAKKGGVFQTIAGVVLAVVGVFTFNPMLVQAGVSMAIGGILQLLAGPKKASNAPKVENQPSYAFDGTTNTDQEGLPVPLAYGRVFVGGARISAGVATDELAITSAGSGMDAQALPAEQPLDPLNDYGFGAE